MVTSPMRFEESALKTRAAPPLLGQHTDAILGRLGYGAEAIAKLREQGTL